MRVEEHLRKRAEELGPEEERHHAFVVLQSGRDEIETTGGIIETCLCKRVRCTCGVELYDDWAVLKGMKDCGCGAGRRKPGRPRLSDEEREEREKQFLASREALRVRRTFKNVMDLRRPVSLGFPARLLQRITVRADASGKSMSAWVTDALTEYLDYLDASGESGGQGDGEEK